MILIGATSKPLLCVATLDKGAAIACTPKALPAGRESRLDQGHVCSPEYGIFRCLVNNSILGVSLIVVNMVYSELWME